MSKLSPAEAEAALLAATYEEVDRIMALSNEELIAEGERDGIDIKQGAAECRFIFECVMRGADRKTRGNA